MENASTSSHVKHPKIRFVIILTIGFAIICSACMLNRMFLSPDSLKQERKNVDQLLKTAEPEDIMQGIKAFEKKVSQRDGRRVFTFGIMPDDYRRLALAYELHGDYDVSMKWLDSIQYNIGEFDVPRVEFKRGNKEEAFKRYCRVYPNFARICSSEKWTDSERFKQRKDVIERTLFVERLSPFRDYNEFLTFINAEYEALGRPVDQTEAVEWYRSMAEVMNAPEGGGEGGQGEATEVAEQADAGDDNTGAAECEAGEP